MPTLAAGPSGARAGRIGTNWIVAEQSSPCSESNTHIKGGDYLDTISLATISGRAHQRASKGHTSTYHIQLHHPPTKPTPLLLIYYLVTYSVSLFLSRDFFFAHWAASFDTKTRFHHTILCCIYWCFCICCAIITFRYFFSIYFTCHFGFLVRLFRVRLGRFRIHSDIASSMQIPLGMDEDSRARDDSARPGHDGQGLGSYPGAVIGGANCRNNSGIA